MGPCPRRSVPTGASSRPGTSNNQSDIALWRIDTGKLVRTISTGHLGPVTALAWRPDGQAIASADGADNTVRIWDAQTGEPDGPTLTGPTNAISGCPSARTGITSPPSSSTPTPGSGISRRAHPGARRCTAMKTV